MHFTSFISTLAAVASVTAFTGPTGKGPFALQVITTDGNNAYSGNFLTSYHTGAGLNALVVENDQRGATHFNYTVQTGHLNATLGPYPYSLVLTGAASASPAPQGYHVAGLNVGGSKNSFNFKTPENILQFGPSFATDNFAICPVAIYTAGNYVPTLVYRAPSGKKNSTCADVKVKAIF